MTHEASTYFGNPAFREYIFLLVEVERLFRHGHGESPQADAIREEMDFPMHRYQAGELDALKEFGKHLTNMSEKYGKILDRDAITPTSTENGAPAMPISAHTRSATEFSK